MKNFLFFLLIIVGSCGRNTSLSEIECSGSNCQHLNAFTLTLAPGDKSIELRFSQTFIIDGTGQTCLPDALEFQISENNQEFENIATVDPFSMTLIVDKLENDKEYFIKMINIHCELDPIVSPVRSAIVGEVPLPEFINNSGNGYDDFRLSSDGSQFIYRTNGDEWYLSSLDDPQTRIKIIDNAYYAEWNPNSDSEITYLQQTYVDILPNLQGITSKSIMHLDLNSNIETTLLEIDHLHDFNHEIHSPEKYWIHEFHYSLDDNSIYFVSNKDNGSSNNFEKEVYSNIWKVDLITGTLEALSDFLPIEFMMNDFIEDSRSIGNFYIIGSFFSELEEVEGENSKHQSTDIHYYNSADNSLTPIFETKNEEKNIDIDPLGDNLIFVSDKTGSDEIWSLNLTSKRLSQETNTAVYIPTSRWNYINWISDNQFMTYVKKGGDHNFATFSVE